MSQIHQAIEAIGHAGCGRSLLRRVRSVRCAAAGRSGVAASEYAILAVAIIIVVGAAVVRLSDPTQGAFVRVAGTLTEVQGGLSTAIPSR